MAYLCIHYKLLVIFDGQFWSSTELLLKCKILFIVSLKLYGSNTDQLNTRCLQDKEKTIILQSEG